MKNVCLAFLTMIEPYLSTYFNNRCIICGCEKKCNSRDAHTMSATLCSLNTLRRGMDRGKGAGAQCYLHSR